MQKNSERHYHYFPGFKGDGKICCGYDPDRREQANRQSIFGHFAPFVVGTCRQIICQFFSGRFVYVIGYIYTVIQPHINTQL